MILLCACTVIAIVLAALAVVLFYVVIDCVTIAVNWLRARRQAGRAQR